MSGKSDAIVYLDITAREEGLPEYSELLAMLKTARTCIAYCRKRYKNEQSGEGIPIELFIDDVIARAEGE